MRLIDADKLKAQVEAHEIKYKFTPTDYQYGHNVGVDKAVADIDDAETVEAIPITYINSRIAEFRAKDTYANQFAANFLQAIINEYNKEAHND